MQTHTNQTDRKASSDQSDQSDQTKEPQLLTVDHTEALKASSRAAAAARLAADNAISKIQFMELYNKNDNNRRKFTGKMAREMALRVTTDISHQGSIGESLNSQIDHHSVPDWKRMAFKDRLPWELVAQLLHDRPYIKPNIIPEFTETQQAILEKVKKTLAAFVISRFIRCLCYQKKVKTITEATQAVYRELDWGWGEKVYQEALKIELDHCSRGAFQICSEIPHTIHYRGISMGDGVNARTDILIRERDTGKKMLLELKAVSGDKSAITKARQQCLRYLRMMKLPIGMVINFPDKPASKPYISVVYNPKV